MIYSSPRLARAYAEDRPPVHSLILAHAGLGYCSSALDIGCGAGLSAHALLPYADRVVGVEPSPAMLTAARTPSPLPGSADGGPDSGRPGVGVPADGGLGAGCLDVSVSAAGGSGTERPGVGDPDGGASSASGGGLPGTLAGFSERLWFVAGKAEQLPFRDNSFELVTAGGSMNYADLGLAVPEVHRVLAPGGTFVLMDFSEGSAPQLSAWWREFASRYPFAPGYEMARWDWLSYVDVRVTHSMTFDEYLRYVLSEVNVEEAIQRGEPFAGIHSWCAESLAAIFRSSALDIHFAAYVAVYQSPAEV